MPNDTVLAGLRRELTRELFEELTALQCAPEEIIGYVGTDERKLRRWCRRTYGRPLETMMDMIRMNTAPFARRLAVGDSYTFLMKELEKVDENILEPLSGTDWPRDMPVITGGGIIESIASVDVTYASTGGEDDNLFFEAANDIPVIQADMSKSVARTFNFAEYMSFPTMEDLIQSHLCQGAAKSLKLKLLPDSKGLYFFRCEKKAASYMIRMIMS